jgi:hypothetical protein
MAGAGIGCLAGLGIMLLMISDCVKRCCLGDFRR